MPICNITNITMKIVESHDAILLIAFESTKIKVFLDLFII